MRRLKGHLSGVSEERDVKKAATHLAKTPGGVRVHKGEHAAVSAAAVCRALGVHRSGSHAGLKLPLDERAGEDRRLRGPIKQTWRESECVYADRKATPDLRDVMTDFR